jgi:hypothetical protein
MLPVYVSWMERSAGCFVRSSSSEAEAGQSCVTHDVYKRDMRVEAELPMTWTASGG